MPFVSFEERRAQWRRDAIARHTAQQARRQKPARARDTSLRIEWLERGEWVVRCGAVNLAWFRERAEAEAFVAVGAR